MRRDVILNDELHSAMKHTHQDNPYLVKTATTPEFEVTTI